MGLLGGSGQLRPVAGIGNSHISMSQEILTRFQSWMTRTFSFCTAISSVFGNAWLFPVSWQHQESSWQPGAQSPPSAIFSMLL